MTGKSKRGLLRGFVELSFCFFWNYTRDNLGPGSGSRSLLFYWLSACCNQWMISYGDALFLCGTINSISLWGIRLSVDHWVITRICSEGDLRAAQVRMCCRWFVGTEECHWSCIFISTLHRCSPQSNRSRYEASFYIQMLSYIPHLWRCFHLVVR